jgi:hypothetical protein
MNKGKFQKGNKGKPKGAINKTTAETKELIQNIVSSKLENINELLEQLEPKEQLDVIIKLLPYIVPKQQEITIDDTPIINIKPIHWVKIAEK